MSYTNILIPLLIGLLLLLAPQLFTKATGEAFERAKQRFRGIGLLLLGVASVYVIVRVAETSDQTGAGRGRGLGVSRGPLALSFDEIVVGQKPPEGVTCL